MKYVILGIVGIFVLSIWWFTPRTTHNRENPHFLNDKPTIVEQVEREKPLPLSSDNEKSASADSLHLLEEKNVLFQQKLIALEEEIKILKKNKNTTGQVTEYQVEHQEDVTLSTTSRSEQNAKKKLQFEQHIQQLDYTLQTDDIDDTKKDTIHQKIQDALSASDLDGNIVIESADCSSALCKIELNGEPADGKDTLSMLLGQDVFDENTEVLSIPNKNNGWTLYISAIGQLTQSTR